MRQIVIIVILVLGTVVFGQLIGAFGLTDIDSCNDCELNTSQSPSHLRSQDLFERQSLKPQDIYFTASGNPVYLVAAEKSSDTQIELSQQRVFDALGKEVDLTGRTVVSVFDKRDAVAASNTIRLTAVPITESKKIEHTQPQVDKYVSGDGHVRPQKSGSSSRDNASNRYLLESAKSSTEKKSAMDSVSNETAKHSVASTKTTAEQQAAINQTVGQPRPADQVVATDVSQTPNANRLLHIGLPTGLAVATLAHSAYRDDKRSSESMSTPSYEEKLVQKSTASITQQAIHADSVTRPNRSMVTKDVSKLIGFSSTDDDTTTDDLSDDIDDIQDELDDLSDTVSDLNTTVTNVQTDVTSLQDDVTTIQGQLGSNDVDAIATQLESLESKTFAGIAAAASLVTPIPSEPGKTIINVGSGYYEGQTAIGISMSRRMTNINGYLYSGVASGVSEIESPLVRVGVGIEF